MIEVESLSKSYGSHRALDAISFSVERGEVVGFLGPNGAGKSTTMRILTGFLSATSGTARVLGHDVERDSLAVRQRIGYLPESTPLYSELRVDEMVRLAAELRGVPSSELEQRMFDALSDCSLLDVLGKTIRQLSKGYRQRVGLAQALVHRPDLLILDEPTSGLDPNQIGEVRDLIQRLSERHTVVLSTHTLQEVVASCSRVLILDRGRLVADGSLDEVTRSVPTKAVNVRVSGDFEAVKAALSAASLSGEESSRDGAQAWWRVVRSGPGADPKSAPESARVARALVKGGVDLLELQPESASLEEAFRHLTQGEVVDA
ncbi:MAG: ATP-binding cassette domain-containing protein [Planctomycetota bacterium]